MIAIAQCLFPRAGQKEALVALSAVLAGAVGSLATVGGDRDHDAARSLVANCSGRGRLTRRAQ